MDGFSIVKWERVKEIAAMCRVSWSVFEMIEFKDHHGISLGRFATVDEAHAFLCGYEHSRSLWEDSK